MPASRSALSLALLALAAGPTARPDDLAGLKARGALRVIVAADEAPETFDPRGGARSGFERELLETFTRLQGLRLEVVLAKTYPDRIPMLVAGKGDLVVAIFDTLERRQQVAFTAEVMPTYTVAVTLAPRVAVRTVDDLRREKVGAIRGTAPAEDAAASGIDSIRRFETWPGMMAALSSGEVSALVVPISEFAIAAKTDRRLTAGVAVGPAGSVAWAVRKEDVALRAALDQHLANVRKSASWNLLLVKYFGEQAPLVLGRRR